MTNTYKDNATLTYMEDRERLQLLGRQVMRRVMNEAVEELRSMHADNQAHGKIESLLTDQAAVEKLLLSTTQEVIGPGADVQG